MDLYSDLEGDPTNGKQQETDLYEDVSLGLTHPLRPPPHHKYQLYVGNLTWWTSDQDVADAVATLGIRDLLDVKFFEYRPNGQSKGFCVVTFGSEQSIVSCLEGLPKIVLHGNNPVVTYPTKNALQQFEATCKPRPPSNPSPQQPVTSVNCAVLAPVGGGPMLHQHAPPPIHQPPPLWHPANVHNRPPPPLPPRPPMHPSVPPRPDWNRPPPNIVNFSPQAVPLHRPPPAFPPPKPLTMDNLGPKVGAPYLPHDVSLNLAEQVHRAPPPIYGTVQTGANGCPARPSRHQEVLGATPVKESNHEEVVERNRSVASCAITRALSSAASGEFAVAIETLVTALSVIKHSEAGKDERCKSLISSLQETLHKVESKSYGSTKRERSRSKERERFARRYRRDRSRSRERERSRDRERDRHYYDNYYRDRSHSREDRYYEDRYKDRRESDRDRDRRESDRDRRDERETSRRDSDRERDTSRRDDRDQLSRRESERERDREREKEGSRRDMEADREPSTRESEKESRREMEKEVVRRETSRRDVDRDETRRENDWERDSRRDQHRRESEREKYYKLVEKEQSRESKQV